MNPGDIIKSLKTIYVWVPSNSHAKTLIKELIIQLGGRCD